MCTERTPWEKCVEFHGHTCPGLVLGFKAAEIALKELGVSRAGDEELVAVVENDACGVDAVQVLTGCTMGKGNLLFQDFGKQVFTIGNRRSGRAVRVAVRPGVMNRDPEHQRLQELVMKGEAAPEEAERFRKIHVEKAREILALPVDDFCRIEEVDWDFPKKARIFNTIICGECGEGAMEARVRVKNGKMVCLQCAGQEYTRGW